MVRPIDTKDTGLTILREPPDYSIDIVAIHGLGAHPFDTWTVQINQGSNEVPQYVNWLNSPNMLPESVPEARIMCFGYRSQWYGDKSIETGSISLSGAAERLLLELKDKRQDSRRPIVFVAHSFGGLVLIKALRLSYDDPQKWSNQYASTIGLIFLGVPFRGRYGMNHREMVIAAIKATSEDQVWPESLEFALPGNEYLREMVRNFLGMRNKDCPIPLRCFYETLPSDVGAIVKAPPERKYVVPPESACLDEIGDISCHPLERNHYNLNKFGSPSDEAYTAVRKAIVDVIEKAPEMLEHRTRALGGPTTTKIPVPRLQFGLHRNASRQDAVSSQHKPKVDIMQRATYLLLPNIVAPDHARLGRLTTDIYAPGHDPCPRLPLEGPDLRGFSSQPLVQHQARGIFLDERFAPIRRELSGLLQIDFSRNRADDRHWSTGVLTTRTILAHEIYLRQLAKNDKQVRDFINSAWNPEDKKNRKEVFLIVGLKEWAEAAAERAGSNGPNSSTSRGFVATEPAQMSNSDVYARLQEELNANRIAGHSSNHTDGVVFAVQYRRVKQSPLTKLILEDAKRLGQSIFSGDEDRTDRDTRRSQVDTENELDFELDESLDENYLERGDLEFSRLDLGNDDIIFRVQQ